VDGFEAGKFKAIVTCELLTEGVDVPKAKVGISLGGDSSQRKSIQRLGRILRKTGNAHAIYYDVFCSNSSDETGPRLAGQSLVRRSPKLPRSFYADQADRPHLR